MTPPWRLPEYRIHPFFDSANPLLLLLTGPLDGNELVSLAQILTPELKLSDWELQNFIIDLDNQEDLYNNTHRGWCPVLIPNWWESTPEIFLEEINLNLRRWISDPNKSLGEQQRTVWEFLLCMWSEHLYHVAD